MEFEDQEWFPQWMRRHQMEFLGYLARTFRLYRPAAPLLQQMLRSHGRTGWTDTASGDGSAAVSLLPWINPAPEQLLLTDRFPQATENANRPDVAYFDLPVRLPGDPIPGNGPITMFNAFHHFDPASQQQILRQASGQGRPVLIAEILQPNLLTLVKVIFVATIGQLICTPFIRPFRIGRLIGVYLLPIHLITTLWDGVVSVIRSRPDRYYDNLAKSLSTGQYTFSFTRLRGSLTSLSVLYGQPSGT